MERAECAFLLWHRGRVRKDSWRERAVSGRVGRRRCWGIGRMWRAVCAEYGSSRVVVDPVILSSHRFGASRRHVGQSENKRVAKEETGNSGM